MDEIKYFEPTGSKSTEELPWVKDWAKATKDFNIPQTVQTVYKGDKGMLLITNLYKSFLFKREQIHTHLVEALDSWVKLGTPTNPLIINVSQGYSVRYGIKESKRKVIWVFEGNRYDIKTKVPTKTKGSTNSNPFLSPNNPTQTTTEEVYSQEEEDANELGGANRGV